MVPYSVMTIRLIGINDLRNFVDAAEKVEGDITCKKGRYVVSAKSILGMMSIDTTSSCEVTYPVDAYKFESFIKQFEVVA
jgi:phosphotransferase system HPr-like phosphotransfer protein